MYQIKILNSKQFDNLPKSETRGSDVSGSLGFANKFTGNAYVRDTKTHELNKYLVEHELEELQASSSTHEDDNGIRHKSFKKVAQWIPGPIGWAPFATDLMRGKEASRYGIKVGGKQPTPGGGSMNTAFPGTINPSAMGGFAPRPSQSAAPTPQGGGGQVAGTLGSGLNNTGVSGLNDETKQRAKGWLSGRTF